MHKGPLAFKPHTKTRRRRNTSFMKIQQKDIRKNAVANKQHKPEGRKQNTMHRKLLGQNGENILKTKL